MKKLIETWLLKCAAVYPDYATMDAPILKAKAAAFVELLHGLSSEQVDTAFRHHLKAKKTFPTPAELLASLTPVKMYRMDNGPRGYNALYPVDHPYVALQHRLGTVLDNYATKVCEADGVNITALEAEARSLPYIPIDRTTEEIADMDDRRGGGFQRINVEWRDGRPQ